MVKKGDTLIEVLLAVGIFSMIAISVVAVLSGGTSSAQNALETTLAREEIDAQAEALRYIHDAYVVDKDSNSSDLPSVQLWRTITNNAINLSGDVSAQNAILQFMPTTCQELYSGDNNIFKNQNPFILNTRNLNAENAAAYINSSAILTPTTTYPRLVFGDSATSNDDTSGLVTDFSSNLYRAEGIYVVAVADNNSTNLVDLDGGVPENGIAFYDFYIRTCWYGTDANTPSTISTVIRLYNPDVITDTVPFYSGINFATPRRVLYQRFSEQDRQQVMNTPGWWPKGYTNGWTFDGWCDKKDIVKEANGESWCKGSLHTSPSILYGTESNNQDNAYNFEPVFSHTKYTIAYNANGGSWATDKQICYADENSGNCVVQGSGINRSGYVFIGWCDGSVFGASCNGKTYQIGNIINAPNDFPSSKLVNLTAIWRAPISYTLSYNPNGGTWSNLSSDSITVTCDEPTLFSGGCTISSDNITRSGYVFTGWCEGVINADGTCRGTKYEKGTNVYNNIIADRAISLNAMWREQNETITVKLTFGYSDCDSHVEGQKSDNTAFHAYYANKIGSDVSGLTIAQLDYDYTNGGTETFTINTLGGRNYYYYVRNYRGCNLYSSGTYVTVSGPYLGTRTFYSSDATGNGEYWNVFAFKNGQIVVRQTRSYSPEISY